MLIIYTLVRKNDERSSSINIFVLHSVTQSLRHWYNRFWPITQQNSVKQNIIFFFSTPYFIVTCLLFWLSAFLLVCLVIFQLLRKYGQFVIALPSNPDEVFFSQKFRIRSISITCSMCYNFWSGCLYENETPHLGHPAYKPGSVLGKPQKALFLSGPATKALPPPSSLVAGSLKKDFLK